MAIRIGPTPVMARWTGRAEGDVRPDAPGAPERSRRILDRRWCWVRQVHGSEVVVAGPGTESGEEADAVVSADPEVALAVFSADCATVALASPEGVMGAVHAGWKGVVAGVIGRAVEAVRSLGATSVFAGLGPCIRPECYEFGLADLDRVAAAVGPAARSVTRFGAPALDLPAAVAGALAEAGAELVVSDPTCTGCSPDHFSYRARGSVERQALVVWRP
jgi:YfiH family protein